MDIKVIARNRKANFEYFIEESFEAGIALTGSEIKSIRAGQVSLQEAYIQIDGRQAFLINCHIAPYQFGSYSDHDPKRPRKLLLHKKEIRRLWAEVRQRGVTIIPVKMYLKNGKAKLEIAIAKGKKLYDKRESIAKKDQQRDVERQLRDRE
ncbi:MAG TPA: SsrA-binding protein SmpB [Anaerolineaceae bacterium]|nr:SsrA-binding protein SmpB [Anaerolineaceae bacterium]HOV05630.1 SsrA-binding protein SmpB [Anaerolineaceae bacterium]